MNIRDILLIIIIIYLVISYCKRKNIENFALSTDDKNEVRVLIKEIYNTDMDAIRTLAKMADDIQKGGLKVNGNLIVSGTITSTGDISSAKYSLSGLNTSIGATDTALTATEKTLTTNLTAAVKAINTDLDKKISKDSKIRLAVVNEKGVNFPNHTLFKRSDGIIGTYHLVDWLMTDKWTISEV